MRLHLILYNIALAFAAVLVIISCDKVPINGPLDGMWQLTDIETSTGKTDAKPSRAYLSIQLHLSEWEINGKRYYSAFSKDNDSIYFERFRHHSLHRTSADDNEEVTTEELAAGAFDAFGIHTPSANFHINRLDGSHLELQRADTILIFRKF